MKTKTNSDLSERLPCVDNPALIEELTCAYRNIVRDHAENYQYYSWCNFNLRLTALEKLFFMKYAEKKGTNMTTSIRRYISQMMDKNPDIVDEAKDYLDKYEFVEGL